MRSLRILHLEDDPLDAELMAATLAGDFAADIRVVATEGDFTAALTGQRFDLILADYSLPSFNGLEALKLARQLASDVPFIFVSGALGEEVAIDTLKQVATDYVLKQRLERLVPAVRRALRESEERAALRRAEQERARLISELRAANATKDQFLAVLSHELRTPLTPVLAAVSAIDRDGTEVPPGFRPLLSLIRRNIELEARLIDDLLDLTRIARGKLPLSISSTDAHSTIRSALDICQMDIEAKGLHVGASLVAREFHVSADPARLQQVFWNLIKNAVKFTPANGCVGIRTRNVDGNAFEFQVSDSGIGIDSAVLPRIFNAFEQGGQDITHRFGGLGLGLAITRALVQAMGGEISASSAGRGNGATFTIQFPTIAPPKVQVRQPVPSPAVGAEEPLRILLVEDHEDTARVLARLLKSLGYRVSTAGSVQTALEAAERESFDLIVSDIGLPDGSGLDLMRTLRQRGPVRGIALSGFGMDSDIRKSQEAGFAEHLTKPIEFQKLEAAIQHVAGQPA